jgi:hypothetical protein
MILIYLFIFQICFCFLKFNFFLMIFKDILVRKISNSRVTTFRSILTPIANRVAHL